MLEVRVAARWLWKHVTLLGKLDSGSAHTMGTSYSGLYEEGSVSNITTTHNPNMLARRWPEQKQSSKAVRLHSPGKEVSPTAWAQKNNYWTPLIIFKNGLGNNYLYFNLCANPVTFKRSLAPVNCISPDSPLVTWMYAYTSRIWTCNLMKLFKRKCRQIWGWYQITYLSRTSS